MGFAADSIADVIAPPPPRAQRASAPERDDGPSFADHLEQSDEAERPDKPRAEKPTAERPRRAADDEDTQATTDDASEAAPQSTAVQPIETPPQPAPLLAQLLAQAKSTPDAKPAQTPDAAPIQPTQPQDGVLSPNPQGGIAGQAAPPQAAEQAMEAAPLLTPAMTQPGPKTKGTPKASEPSAPEAPAADGVAPTTQQQAPEAAAAVVQAAPAPEAQAPAQRETRDIAINTNSARTTKAPASQAAPQAPDAPPPADAPKSATPLQQALAALRDGANAANSGEKNTEIKIAAPAQATAPAAAPIAQAAAQTAQVGAEHAATQRVAAAGAQVGHEIVKRFNGESTRFEMRLDPAELGRVDVRLEVSRDNKVSAVITADSPQALQDLVRNARDLEASLQSAGLDLAENGLSFDLNQSGQGFADRGESSGSSSARQGAAPNDDPSPAPVARPLGIESWRGVRIDVMA